MSDDVYPVVRGLHELSRFMSYKDAASCILILEQVEEDIVLSDVKDYADHIHIGQQVLEKLTLEFHEVQSQYADKKDTLGEEGADTWFQEKNQQFFDAHKQEFKLAKKSFNQACSIRFLLDSYTTDLKQADEAERIRLLQHIIELLPKKYYKTIHKLVKAYGKEQDKDTYAQITNELNQLLS